MRIPLDEARDWLRPFPLGRLGASKPFPTILETLASACLAIEEVTHNNLSIFLSAHCPDGWMESPSDVGTIPLAGRAGAQVYLGSIPVECVCMSVGEKVYTLW